MFSFVRFMSLNESYSYWPLRCMWRPRVIVQMSPSFSGWHCFGFPEGTRAQGSKWLAQCCLQIVKPEFKPERKAMLCSFCWTKKVLDLTCGYFMSAFSISMKHHTYACMCIYLISYEGLEKWLSSEECLLLLETHIFGVTQRNTRIKQKQLHEAVSFFQKRV